MGIIKRGILGGFSGSVANVVGSSWKGISTMRSKPLSVANPRTAAQVGNRTRFKAVTLFASELLSGVIKPCWDRFAVQESGYNAFQRANKASFQDNGSFTPADVKLTIGKMVATLIDTFGAGAPGKLAITWDTALVDAYQMANDNVFAVLCDENGNVLEVQSKVDVRSAGTASFTLPVEQAGNEVYAFLGFARADGTIVSMSSWKSCVVPD
jgi:hypothetical protein